MPTGASASAASLATTASACRRRRARRRPRHFRFGATHRHSNSWYPELVIRVENLAIVQGAFELRGLSFEVPAGAYGVLMGRTGCGKTSVLECIAGLRTPTA